MQGWIALHRCLLNKAIWKHPTPEQKTILITLLLMADHEGNEWEWNGKQYKTRPGQMVTSIKGICEKAGHGISPQNVRSAIAKFQKYGFLTNESTKTGRLITITNWGLYQQKLNEGNKGSNGQVTKPQQTGNKAVTTNNNDNNDNNSTNNTSSEKYSDDALEMRMSRYMAKRVKESYAGARLPSNFNKWCQTFNRLMRIDGRTPQEIGKVMEWVYQNEFWCTNIRSPNKLREKWDTLWLQMHRKHKQDRPNKPIEQWTREEREAEGI